ncbi:hypothetical protein BKA62DRAFT_462744 [Auriculariales sp. MPI-PUGE-AT-0066]|nr:hypothetical protein BKA62DRAFT_462744 [Auriculariales sp. MPI-PUGE-AT-0066]
MPLQLFFHGASLIPPRPTISLLACSIVLFSCSGTLSAGAARHQYVNLRHPTQLSLFRCPSSLSADGASHASRNPMHSRVSNRATVSDSSKPTHSPCTLGLHFQTLHILRKIRLQSEERARSFRCNLDGNIAKFQRVLRNLAITSPTCLESVFQSYRVLSTPVNFDVSGAVPSRIV